MVCEIDMTRHFGEHNEHLNNTNLEQRALELMTRCICIARTSFLLDMFNFSIDTCNEINDVSCDITKRHSNEKAKISSKRYQKIFIAKY